MKNPAPKHILVVEDEELLAKTLSEMLKSQGFSVMTALNGREALTLVLKKKPDLILLDLILPSLDGLSVLKKLKSSAGTKNIPVVILTNLFGEQEYTQALKELGTDYLLKADYDPKQVVEFVKKKLGIT